MTMTRKIAGMTHLPSQGSLGLGHPTILYNCFYMRFETHIGKLLPCYPGKTLPIMVLIRVGQGGRDKP
jgi:hypothetical protein